MLFRRAGARHIGASVCRFQSFFDGGREHSRTATHVDACDGVLSDAGSTPAASTISKLLILHTLGLSRPLLKFSGGSDDILRDVLH